MLMNIKSSLILGYDLSYLKLSMKNSSERHNLFHSMPLFAMKGPRLGVAHLCLRRKLPNKWQMKN